MKRFLAKASKPFALPKSLANLGANTVPSTSSEMPHATTGIQPTTGLQPKYLVPAVPHPCPYDHLVLLATKDGLLIRQHLPGLKQKPPSYVRVAWGKAVKVEEITNDRKVDDYDWDEGVVVYGIVGILELFSGTISWFPSTHYWVD